VSLFATNRWTRPRVRAGNPLGSNVRRRQPSWVDKLHGTSVLVTCKAQPDYDEPSQ